MQHILSYGLGLDSTAILARWLLEPDSRDFPLSDLIVLTSMTGDEHTETGQLVEAHILPLMRRHGIRFVQVARATRLISEGFEVLSDTTQPERLHLGGRFTLSAEMTLGGTVPQRGGARLCSAHAKGEVLDAAIARLLADPSPMWPGVHPTDVFTGFIHPFEHYIGFAADELGRMERDSTYGGVNRTSHYPLLDWGWSRARAEAWLEAQFGIRWPKSCCTYCPFAWSSRAKRQQVSARLSAEPDPRLASEPLWMEALAMALNPRQPLIDGGALRVLQEHAPDVVARFSERLARVEQWGLYEVRRAWAGPRTVYRSLRCLERGNRLELEAGLGARLRRTDHGLGYVEFAGRPESGEGREHRLAVIPAVVEEKAHPLFDLWWARLERLEDAGLRCADVDFSVALLAELRAVWGDEVAPLAEVEARFGGSYMKKEIVAARRMWRNPPCGGTGVQPAPDTLGSSPHTGDRQLDR